MRILCDDPTKFIPSQTESTETQECPPPKEAAPDSKPMITTEQLQRNILRLLSAIGDARTCKGCGRQIWWVRSKAGKTMPITDEALNHFVDCPQAAQFKKPKAGPGEALPITHGG